MARGALVLVAGAFGLFALGYATQRPVRQVPATVADDPSLPSVTIDGVTFHAEAHGNPDNPTVVVIHGGPGGDYKNLLVLRALADDYHVVFYDQRGTGLSPRVPAEELTFDTAIEDVHRIVTHYGGGDPVALVGHSWGGMLGAYYAAAHPEFVARGIFAEPGVLTSQELQEFVALMQPGSSLETLTYLVAALFERLHISEPDEDASDDYFIERMMHAPGSGNALNQYWCGGEPPAAADDMWRVGATAMQAVLDSSKGDDGLLQMPPLQASNYPGELLFIASSCNTLIGEQRQRAHAVLFPDARVVVIEDASHLMFTDQPQRSLDVIRSYLGGWSR